jgi:tetratricopeptide (TPR) repeat protein
MSKPNKKERNRKQLPDKPKKSAPVQQLKIDLVFGVLLFFVTFAAYHPAWNGTPIWDDDGHITKPELRSFDGLTRIWTHLGATQQYYPLVHSIFWFEYHLWDESALGYHLVNIFLHFLSALLLVCILRRLAIPGAWFIAAIFTLHPVQVESVAWITELKNTLSGVFFFATALIYLRFDSERKRKYYIIAILLFILGLISKSVIAMLPASLLIVFWWKRGKIDLKRDVAPLLPFFVIGMASGLFTAWVERKFIGAEGSAFTFTIIERCLIAGRVVWFYLAKLTCPVNLIFIYPRWNISQAVWWQYLFPVAALILAGILWALRKHSRAPLAAFLYFTTMIFPVLGFFNVYPFQFSFVADHFQYLACIAPITIVIAGIDHALGNNRFQKLACSIILLFVLVVLTWKQSGIYANAETLYRTIIRKNPLCWMAYNNLGKLLAENGRTDGVMADFQTALKIKPDYSEAHYNIGIQLGKMGQIDMAIAHYRKAIEIKPNYAFAYNNIGLLLAETGQIDEAIIHYRKSLEINLRFAEAWNNLGNALSQIGRIDEAINSFQRALKINPNYGEAHYNFGILLSKLGRTDEAIFQYRKALEINPRDGESYNNLGLLFAQLGRNDEAIDQYQKALETNSNSIEAHNNLGILLAKMGRTDEAIDHYQKALQISPNQISILQNLVDVLVQKDQLNDAIPILEKALSLAKSSGDKSRGKEIEGTLARQ